MGMTIWIRGARPQTLPLGLAPVLVGVAASWRWRLWVACGRAQLFREDCWKSMMLVMCWGIVRFLGRGLRSLRCCAPWWRSVCRLL
ncbi:MAG: hypothetical protein ACLSUZ_05550 [Bifidobacterium pseudocatenulatum]